MSLWNRVRLTAPKLKFCDYNSQEWTFIAEPVRNAVYELQQGLKIIEYRSALHADIAFFCRLMYRNSNFFGHDKQQRSCARVKKCLNRFLAQDMFGLITDLGRHLDKTFGPPYKCSFVQLPSQQYVKYVLVRLQGFSALICRTLVDLEAAFCSCHDNFRNSARNYFYGNLLTMSCIARMWAILKVLLLNCIEWYRSLHELANELNPVGKKWFGNTELPKNLKDWLITLSEGNEKFLVPAKQQSQVSGEGEANTSLLNDFASRKPNKLRADTSELSTAEVKTENDLGASISGEKLGKGKRADANDESLDLLPLAMRIRKVKSIDGLRKFLKEDLKMRMKKEEYYTSHLPQPKRKIFLGRCWSLVKDFKGKSLDTVSIAERLKEWLNEDEIEKTIESWKKKKKKNSKKEKLNKVKQIDNRHKIASETA